MRRLADLPFFVILMGIAGVSMFLPALHAVVLREHAVGRAFLYSGCFILILVAMIAIATAQHRPRNAARNHLVALAAAYVVLPVLLALPLTQRGAGGLDFGAAWFEMLSALTTTGATLFAPDDLPRTVHLWRAQVGWMGGFFVILMALAVLAPLNLGGTEVTSGRAPGRRAGGGAEQIARVAEPSERIWRFALVLFPAYGGVTLVLWLGLIFAGESSFVAICHAMSTLSTSGISPVGGLQGGQSGVWGEALICLFLVTAISRQFLAQGLWRRREGENAGLNEIWLAVGILLVVTAVLFLRHLIGAWLTGDGDGGVAAALSVLWGYFFMVMSFLTTTGFETADWRTAMDWSGVNGFGLVLAGLSVVGGGVATSAGGLKLLRVYALLRHGERELDRLVHPNSVGGSGQAARHLRRQGAYVAWVFFMLFAVSVVVFTAALTLVSVEFEPALMFSLAALTTNGPLASVSGSAVFSYTALDGPALSVIGVAMVVGRLETLAILAVLIPDGWVR